MSGSGLAIVADAVVLIALWLVVVTGWGPRRATAMAVAADSNGRRPIGQTAEGDPPSRAGGPSSSATSPVIGYSVSGPTPGAIDRT